MTDVITAVADEAGALLDDAIALRRRIHRAPELGLELPETQARVLDAIDDLPLTVTTGTRTSSVVAILDGGRPGPTTLLRGDMDALPMPEDTGLDFASTIDGAMHACGHDAHVAMLAGAARLLSGRRGDIAGRVAFMFQPGEEGHHGARVMLEEGLLDHVARGAEPVSMAFAIHQTPSLPSGMIASRGLAFLASSDVLTVTVTGRGGHASMPHEALDPVPVACEIVLALQSMVTRRVDAFDPAVVTIARIRAGTTSNVIPETAQLVGTVRTVSGHRRSAVLAEIQRLAEGIAAAHGATATVAVEAGYPVTVNDVDAARLALDTSTALLGERATVEMPNPIMGAEDWSYILEEVPGCMAFLGTRPDGSGAPAPNHSNKMVIDESAMAAGIAMYAGVALRWADESARHGGAGAD